MGDVLGRRSELAYVIGPSGAGKSLGIAWARRARQEIVVFDLDVVCRDRTSDWDSVRGALTEARERSLERPVIVDIGAGTQHTLPGQLAAFMADSHRATVLVWAPPNEVILRQPLGAGRDLEEFVQTEYESRSRLYSMASHTADVTGLDAANAAALTGGLLLEVLRIGAPID